MAFSENEQARLREVVGAFIEKRRPPPHVRAQADLCYRLAGQRVEIFEICPRWRGAPGETMESPIAKATFVKASNLWSVFRRRADLKWHGYWPMPQVASIEMFLALVAEDNNACFFG